MRNFLIIIVLSVAVAARGEIIRLRNGRSILADSVREIGDRVEYEAGDNTYRIPKALVERIDGARAPLASSTPAVPDAFASPNATGGALVVSPDVLQKIIRDGEISEDGLEQVSRTGNPSRTAAAYYMAAQFSFLRSKRGEAQQYLQRALDYAPEDPMVLTAYATLLIQAGRSLDAVSYAENATRLAPNFPDAFRVLGFAYFNSNRLRDALQAWERSEELRSDSTVRQFMAKAKRDLKAETDFSVHSSSHFDLRYEGRQIDDRVRDQVLESLENAYRELSSQLQVTPEQRIPVVLYTEKTFFDVTQAPTWIGALNDGKLRIPVQGVSSVTGEMQRVLRHEVAHSFIRQAAGGHCPNWLNEGIAQLLEPRTLSDVSAEQLAKTYRSKRQLSLQRLESSFFQLDTDDARLAYTEALVATKYIADRYGMPAIRGMLQRLSEGASMDSALRDTVHADYTLFEAELAQYLTSKYGD